MAKYETRVGLNPPPMPSMKLATPSLAPISSILNKKFNEQIEQRADEAQKRGRSKAMNAQRNEGGFIDTTGLDSLSKYGKIERAEHLRIANAVNRNQRRINYNDLMGNAQSVIKNSPKEEDRLEAINTFKTEMENQKQYADEMGGFEIDMLIQEGMGSLATLNEGVKKARSFKNLKDKTVAGLMSRAMLGDPSDTSFFAELNEAVELSGMTHKDRTRFGHMYLKNMTEGKWVEGVAQSASTTAELFDPENPASIPYNLDKLFMGLQGTEFEKFIGEYEEAAYAKAAEIRGAGLGDQFAEEVLSKTTNKQINALEREKVNPAIKELHDAVKKATGSPVLADKIQKMARTAYNNSVAAKKGELDDLLKADNEAAKLRARADGTVLDEWMDNGPLAIDENGNLNLNEAPLGVFQNLALNGDKSDVKNMKQYDNLVSELAKVKAGRGNSTVSLYFVAQQIGKFVEADPDISDSNLIERVRGLGLNEDAAKLIVSSFTSSPYTKEETAAVFMYRQLPLLTENDLVGDYVKFFQGKNATTSGYLQHLQGVVSGKLKERQGVKFGPKTAEAIARMIPADATEVEKFRAYTMLGAVSDHPFYKSLAGLANMQGNLSIKLNSPDTRIPSAAQFEAVREMIGGTAELAELDNADALAVVVAFEAVNKEAETNAQDKFYQDTHNYQIALAEVYNDYVLDRIDPFGYGDVDLKKRPMFIPKVSNLSAERTVLNAFAIAAEREGVKLDKRAITDIIAAGGRVEFDMGTGSFIVSNHLGVKVRVSQKEIIAYQEEIVGKVKPATTNFPVIKEDV